MKNIKFFFALLLVAILSFATMAQSPWLLQRVSGLPNSVNPLVLFSALDENVCWGIQYEYNSPEYVRTTDGGLSWSVSAIQGTVGLQGASIAAIDANKAWVAIFDPSGATSGGVFKTTNAGIDWMRDTTIFLGSGGHPNDIHFFDPNNGVVIGNPRGGNWEIYTTANGGTNWTQVPFSNIPPPALNEFTGAGLFASAGNNIWFGTFAGGNSVYRSTDRGITWSAAHNLFADGFFCLAFKDSLNGLACSPFGVINQISRTTDGGVTWTAIPNVPSTPSPYFISYIRETPGAYIITSHNNIAHPVLTIPGSAYSTNDGASWILVDNLPHQKAEFVSALVGWSGGLNDSVYKWNSNLLITTIPTDSLQLWLKADEGVILNGSTVSSWIDQSGKGNNVIQPSADRQPLLVANELNNKPVLRFDGLNDMLGLTGTKTMSQISLFMVYKVDSGATGPNPNFPLVLGDANIAGGAYGLTMQPADFSPTPNTLAIWTASDAWLLASLTDITKYGEWKNLSIVTNQTIHNTTVHSNGQEANIIPQGSDMGISFSLGNAGGPGHGGGIGGADGTPSPPSNKLIFKGDIAEIMLYDIVLTDSESLAVENYLSVKYNIQTVLPVELTSFTAQAQDAKVILNWATATELNNRGFEIQRKVIEGDFTAVGFVKGEGTTTNQKEYSYVDKNLADGKYFYRLKQLDLGGAYEYSKTIEVDVISLNSFTLEQNYPNPFNPSTRISWQSPVGSWQVLKVFDVLGNEVATLVNEYKPAGSYEVNFDGASLSSGVYLYKLQAGSFVETKKLMLLK